VKVDIENTNKQFNHIIEPNTPPSILCAQNKDEISNIMTHSLSIENESISYNDTSFIEYLFYFLQNYKTFFIKLKNIFFFYYFQDTSWSQISRYKSFFHANNEQSA